MLERPSVGYFNHKPRASSKTVARNKLVYIFLTLLQKIRLKEEL